MQVILLHLSQCFFRRLPAEWSVTSENYQWAAVFYLCAFWAVQSLLIGDPSEALVAAGSELALTQTFVFVVLWVSGRRHAFVPTASLLMGAVGFVGLLTLPLLVWLRLAEGTALVTIFYILVGFALWALAVLGHIFRQALARTPSFGFGVACAYAVETYLGTLFLLVL